jgi:hypothetical protein
MVDEQPQIELGALQLRRRQGIQRVCPMFCVRSG